MPTFQEIASLMESWAPIPAAESYDNVGLLVGFPETEITGILIHLDVTEAVLEEARQKGANLIITHHPIWFMSRKRLTGEDYISRIIIRAIQYGIGLYACHTNLDNIRTGVNAVIAEKLGLQNPQFLLPKPASTDLGSGMIGNLVEPLSKRDFLARIKSIFNCGGIRYSDTYKEEILRVAVCGGAGSFLTGAAIAGGADAFVTADITYHKFFDNEDKLLLLDIGHFESEQYTSELILQFITEKFPTFAVYLSETPTNPVKYY